MSSSPSPLGVWPAAGPGATVAGCCVAGGCSLDAVLIGLKTGLILGCAADSVLELSAAAPPLAAALLPAAASLLATASPSGWRLQDELVRLECCLLLMGDPMCCESVPLSMSLIDTRGDAIESRFAKGPFSLRCSSCSCRCREERHSNLSPLQREWCIFLLTWQEHTLRQMPVLAASAV
jgi:hypothetical protein